MNNRIMVALDGQTGGQADRRAGGRVDRRTGEQTVVPWSWTDTRHKDVSYVCGRTYVVAVVV